jgi:hypothetical protein
LGEHWLLAARYGNQSIGDVDVFTETSRNLRRLVAEVVIPEITA